MCGTRDNNIYKSKHKDDTSTKENRALRDI